MGKSAPAAPAPPDPYKTASAQTGTNIQSAIANATIGNANTYGPTGSTIYKQIGQQSITGPDGQAYQVPQYSSTTTLSPEQQQLYNQQTQLGSDVNNLALKQVGQLGDTLGKPVDTSALPSVANDFSADRSAVENALFNRLNPQLQLQRDALENKLVNQGFQRGTAAFNNAMDQENRQENDARLAITGQGLQEQQGLNSMAQANRQRALQETLAIRNQPLNEISALRSGGQVSLPNAPQFNAPTVANTDLSGDLYNTAAIQNSQYGQQMQQYNQQLAGMYGLGSAALGAGGYALGKNGWPSDRRLKREIIDLGIRLVNGLKLYAYRYLWDDKPRAGVMADEVLRVKPDAVGLMNGFLTVDYRSLA